MFNTIRDELVNDPLIAGQPDFSRAWLQKVRERTPYQHQYNCHLLAVISVYYAFGVTAAPTRDMHITKLDALRCWSSMCLAGSSTEAWLYLTF